MSRSDVQAEGAQIVLVGSFNPVIISGGWLLAQDLIGQSDVDDSEEFPSPGLASSFRAGWLRCDVSVDRLQLSCESPAEYDRLRDVGVGILRILNHTPLSALGINRYFHCSVKDMSAWHRIGDTLAPKAEWSELILPGMKDVTITSVRPDRFGGEVNVSVQPSVIAIPGIFVAQNAHFVLRVVDHQPTDRDEFFDREVLGNHSPVRCSVRGHHGQRPPMTRIVE